jgi:uncharacterized protein (UPF0333 family)
MKMDQRAQISIEYVLFLALVVVIVLVFAGFIGDQFELNTVSSAAKLGAENATTNMVITNSNMEPVRVTNISMNASNSTENVTLALSRSLTAAQDVVVLSNIKQSLIAQGYNPIYDPNTMNNVTLQTSRHNYTIKLA